MGQGVSLIGTWMQQVSMSWLVYRMTNSAFLLGLVGFTSLFPVFILSPLTGVVADKHNRRKILIITQIASMVQALVLAFLVLSDLIQVWHILLLSCLLGLVNSFDVPARQSFVIDMVENKNDLSNAIALNSTMFNSARLIGPSIAGILIAVLGEGVCFLLNGISYLFVILALVLMKINYKKHAEHEAPILLGLKHGFKYVSSSIPIKYILLLLGMMGLLGMQYVVLMPIFATKILGGGPHTLGFFMAATGIGALTGSLHLASRKNILGLGKIIAFSPALFGISLICFSFSHYLPLSLVMMFITGFALIRQTTSSNTVVQMIVDDDKRGRVMSLFAMAFIGMSPFGSLLIGSIADKIGAPNALIISGVCCILGSLLFVKNLPKIRKHLRPIYVKKGIIQEDMPRIVQ